MKFSILILYISFTLTSFSQSEYKWLNLPNVISTYPYIDEFLNLHGSVKSLHQYVGYNNPPINLEWIIQFKKNRNVTSVHHFNDGFPSEISSFTYFNFIYDSSGNLVNEMKSLVSKGDTVILNKQDDISWFRNTLPEPIEVNKMGYSVVFTLHEDTTYSFYDQQGRKILDSIPDNGHNLSHKIVYTYSDTVVESKFIFTSKSELNYSISYLLDDKGNWIEKNIVHTNEFSSPVTYRRQILYYKEE